MNKNLLIIGFVWPEPKSSAAGCRMLQLIEAFQLQNYEITFASACTKTENAFNLERIGITQTTIELNSSSFDEFVKTLNPDVVLFDRFMIEEQFGWRVAEQCPNALRILDTEDLHCLRKGRQQAFKEGKEFDVSYLFNNTAKREIASIYRSDLSLIISEDETDFLTSYFEIGYDLFMYLPFMLDTIEDETIQSFPKFEDRQHFITIGNFLHEPNYDSVVYLKETIWPLIRKQLPKAELHIYGSYASQKVNQLHNENDGFLIKGFVEDVNQVMQNAKVCLAPLRFGAGLKGKLIDAMQNGTPCVMTNIAAEGLFSYLEPNGLIDDNPETFANNAIALYKENDLWQEKQNNGFISINTHFNKIQYQNKLKERIKEIAEQLNNKRQNNFIGQMLQHHALQSTKYLSKWIEEKNK